MQNKPFSAPGSTQQQEAGAEFAPKFGADGLITAIVCDADSGKLLMVAHMNELAVMRTLETGEAHYWSRSRGELWHKGKTSGNVQKVVEIATDCDQDALLLRVKVTGHGATCHTGRLSCFYRTLVFKDGKTTLEFSKDAPLFNPDDVYGQ